MNDVHIRVPITCPVCSRESLLSLRADAILDALEATAPLRLSVSCHCHAWFASSDEIEQMREYLLATFSFSAANLTPSSALDPGAMG
jgi:hypothetical protein